MDSQEFWGAIKARGLNFFAGVPDSTFGAAYNYMVNDPEIRYVPAVRGTADHPMTRDEVLAKGLDLVNSVYGDARGAQVVDAVMALESLADVRDLRSLLTEA